LDNFDNKGVKVCCKVSSLAAR